MDGGKGELPPSSFPSEARRGKGGISINASSDYLLLANERRDGRRWH